MAVTRPARITEYLRHEFTQAERLQMGSELAQAHNRVQTIEEEEAVVKSQFKERKTVVEQDIGKLSRHLANGFEMRNIVCLLEYDKPNMGEVSYRREDNGDFVKARAMNREELQMDLPLDTPAQVGESVAKSAEAAEDFFKPGRPTDLPTAETAAPVPEPPPAAPANPVLALPSKKSGPKVLPVH